MTAAATRLRTTRAVLFDNCPHAAHLADLEPDYDTHQQARGTVFHEFARRVLDECEAASDPKMDPGFARDLMLDCIRTSGLPLNTFEHDQLLVLATEFVTARTFDTTYLVDTEEQYEVERNGVIFTGRPDRLDIRDGVATIRDYKTGWAIDTDAALRGTGQGRIYAYAIFFAYPQVHTVRLLWDYPRWGAEPRTAELTRDDLPEIEALLDSLAARYLTALSDDDWAASPGSWCQLCPNASACPLPAEFRGEGRVTTPEAAKAAARLLVVLDQIRRREMRALRAYCGEHGPVDAGDLVYDFKLKADSDRVIDKDALRAAMVKAEIPWDEHFTHVKGSTEFKARKAVTA